MGVESAHTPIDGATLVAAATRIVDYAANHGLVGWADRVWGANAVLEAVERRDFSRLMEYAHAVAEAALWETEHNAKWLACISTIREAWLEHMREGV